MIIHYDGQSESLMQTLSSWEKEGKVTFMDRVRKRAEKILSEPAPEPLENGLVRNITEMVRASEKQGQ